MPHVVNRVSSIVGKWVRHSALVLSSRPSLLRQDGIRPVSTIQVILWKNKTKHPPFVPALWKEQVWKTGCFFCCTGHMGPASALGIWRNLKLHKCTKHWKKLDNWGTSLALIFFPSSFSSSKRRRRKKTTTKKDGRTTEWSGWSHYTEAR